QKISNAGRDDLVEFHEPIASHSNGECESDDQRGAEHGPSDAPFDEEVRIEKDDVQRKPDRKMREKHTEQDAANLLAFHYVFNSSHAVKERGHAGDVIEHGKAKGSVNQGQKPGAQNSVEFGGSSNACEKPDQ